MSVYIYIYIYCLDQTTEKGLNNLKRRDSPLCNFTESCRSDLVKTLCPKKCGKDLIYLVTLVSKVRKKYFVIYKYLIFSMTFRT